MIRSVLRRARNVRLLFRRGFWEWLVERCDFLVTDHLEPWTLVQRGKNSMIHPSVSFREAQNIHIGSHTRIQSGSVLWASPNSRIVIGDYTGLGPGTMIFSSNHNFEAGTPYVRQSWVEKGVTIGRDVWIGAGCILVPGAEVGDGCVVAAGSVVTGVIPRNSVAAGTPARVLRLREPRLGEPESEERVLE